MKEILDLFLHLQDHLHAFTRDHGPLVYGLLFLIVFCETGLVVTPFLPGDSLLFAVGMVSAQPGSGLNFWIAMVILLVAAILGDTVNYWIGRKCGMGMARRFPRFVKVEHLEKTREYFTRYGGKTIIIARFVPIVRTFAPFVAGMGAMDYRRFMSFNVIGALLWVGLLLPAGRLLAEVVVNWQFNFFGNPVHIKFAVKEQFELIVFAIIGISVLPIFIEYIRAKRTARKAKAAEVGAPE